MPVGTAGYTYGRGGGGAKSLRPALLAAQPKQTLIPHNRTSHSWTRAVLKGEKRVRNTKGSKRSWGRSLPHGQHTGKTQNHRNNVEKGLAVGGGWWRSAVVSWWRLVAVGGSWWQLVPGGCP